MTVELREPVAAVPAALARYDLTLSDDGGKLIYTYDTRGERTGITDLLENLRSAGLALKDLSTTQSSLEDIFVGLVSKRK
jgi:ABC-2 type transport system ATP-binding protein